MINDLRTLSMVDTINIAALLTFLHIDMPAVQNLAIITAVLVNILTIGKIIKNSFSNNKQSKL